MAHMSLGPFIKKFYSSFAITPQHFILEKKLELAALYLLQSDESISAIAEKCGFCNRYYFTRIFKAATGFSVMEYIIYSRVLRARQLLQEGVSVQQAGERSGFSDNSHFIRTFGHLTGVTPGRYAKEYQSSDQVLLHDSIRHP